MLLLDEPTNHLDADGLAWLEDFPRRLRRRAARRLARPPLPRRRGRPHPRAAAGGALETYEGGYTAYRDERARRRARLEQLVEAQDKRRRRLEADIADTRDHARRSERSASGMGADKQKRYAKKVAKKAKAREHRLEREINAETWVERPREAAGRPRSGSTPPPTAAAASRRLRGAARPRARERRPHAPRRRPRRRLRRQRGRQDDAAEPPARHAAADRRRDRGDDERPPAPAAPAGSRRHRPAAAVVPPPGGGPASTSPARARCSPTSASTPTRSGARSSASARASGRARRSPRSSPPRPTCCCSTSRPTTSTSTRSRCSSARSPASPSTIVAVSHDRWFLDAIGTTRHLHVEDGAVYEAAAGRPRASSARRRRTSASRAGPRAGRSRRTTMPSRSYSGPSITRPADRLDDRRAAAPVDALAVDRDREVVGERRARDELRHRDDERAGLDRDVAHRGQPAVGVVGGRRHPDLRAAAVDGVARQRHPVLPADQPADAAELGRRPRRGRGPRRSRGRAARAGSASACGACAAALRARSAAACCRASRGGRPRAR